MTGYPLMQIWVIAGFACFVQAVGLYFQYRKHTYFSHPSLFTWVYAFGCVGLVEISETFLPRSALDWNWLLAIAWFVLVCMIMIYNRRFPVPISYSQRHAASYFLRFDMTFVVVKALDILFQQLFLLAFVAALYQLYADVLAVTLMTMVIFVGAHIPLLLIQKKVSLLHLIGASMFIGIVPWALLRVEGGLWWMYLGHWGFYVLMRVMLGRRAVRQSVLAEDIIVQG